MNSLFLTAWLVLLVVNGCANQATVRSNINLEKLIKGKSKALPDRHEAIPNTYFELTAGSGNNAANPQTLNSAVGTLGSTGEVVCVSARDRTESQNAGRCEVTVGGAKFTLKPRDAVTLKGSGEVALTCTGDAPTNCKALVVN